MLKILIAEDELTMRKILKKLVEGFGYEAVEVENGSDALDELSKKDAPKLALIDWEMPGLSGVEVCEIIRETKQEHQPYIIILTTHNEPEDIATALNAGADDYIVKPYSPIELKARLGVGKRVIESASKVKQLEGLLPICAACKKIKDGDNYWQAVETYLSGLGDVDFTHSICPECMERLYPDFVASQKEQT